MDLRLAPNLAASIFILLTMDSRKSKDKHLIFVLCLDDITGLTKEPLALANPVAGSRIRLVVVPKKNNH